MGRPGKASILLVFLFLSFVRLFGQQDLDRNSFYTAMASNRIQRIDEEIQRIAKTQLPGKEAYQGALLMKKAGLSSGASKKLSLFKTGRRKLDAEIRKDSTNGEFRFLRIMIEEHAPGLVGYRGDLSSDHDVLIRRFRSLNPETQRSVISYSKNSRILKPAEF
jgi:hypothetical protein